MKQAKTYSSTFVFGFILVTMLVMIGFMIVSKEFGGLNPKRGWNSDFLDFKEAFMTFHRSSEKRLSDNFTDGTSIDLSTEDLFSRFTGQQVRIKEKTEYELINVSKAVLHRKTLTMLSFATPKFSAEKAGQTLDSREVISFALYPIAKRQLPKTDKMVAGSFLWHMYSWKSDRSQAELVSGNNKPQTGNLNFIAANYMNDYYAFALGEMSFSKLSTEILKPLSLYNPKYVRTLTD